MAYDGVQLQLKKKSKFEIILLSFAIYIHRFFKRSLLWEKTDAERECRKDEYILREKESKGKEKKLSYSFLSPEHARNKRSTVLQPVLFTLKWIMAQQYDSFAKC